MDGNSRRKHHPRCLLRGDTKDLCGHPSNTVFQRRCTAAGPDLRIARPMAWSLEKISDIFVSLFGRGNSPEKKSLTEDKFKALVDAGHQEGALDESQKDLIHRVFELTDTRVSDMMIPRVDMFCLPMSMNIQEVEREIIKERASRIPVYGTDKDNILGILHSKTPVGPR